MQAKGKDFDKYINIDLTENANDEIDRTSPQPDQILLNDLLSNQHSDKQEAIEELGHGFIEKSRQ